MLSTYKNVLRPGHNHLLTTGADDQILSLSSECQRGERSSVLVVSRWCSGDNQSVGSSVLLVSKWLRPGNRTFLEVASMAVTWWIVALLHSVT